jgi:hypothetical protein
MWNFLLLFRLLFHQVSCFHRALLKIGKLGGGVGDGEIDATARALAIPYIICI